jgi:hypothetical protein
MRLSFVVRHHPDRPSKRGDYFELDYVGIMVAARPLFSHHRVAASCCHGFESYDGIQDFVLGGYRAR